MEKLEIIIMVFLFCLVVLGVYVVIVWIFVWKKKKEDEGGCVEVLYKYLEEEVENVWKKVVMVYV